MLTNRITALLLTSGAAGLVLAATLLQPAAPTPASVRETVLAIADPPPPTEHVLGDDAESRQKTARKAWFKELHRAAPDVDVREIERVNGLAHIRRRNLLATAPPTEPEWGTWVERGSQNQAGRMHVARRTDEGTLYAGSSKGGLWVSPVDGSGWTPIGDNLYGGAHWMELVDLGGEHPRILAGTDSGLVHTSDDQGRTWQVPQGVEGWRRLRRMTMAHDGSQTLYLVGSPDWWDFNLYRSTDGGDSFHEIVDMGQYEGDVWAPREGDDTRLYMALHDQLSVSDDQGSSWSVVGTITSGAERVELVGSEDGAPTLYSVTDGSKLHRSEDAGKSWVFMHDVSDYWGTLQAGRDNAELVAWGGVEVHVSSTGGQSFQSLNRWWDYYGDPLTQLHADIPGLDVERDASGNEVWYISTDGGLYHSLDGLTTVQNLSLDGLRVSQYYGTLTSSANPDHVAAGAQDQGYQWTQGQSQEGPVWLFEQAISGDYAHLVSTGGTHEAVYSVYPGFILVQLGEDEPTLTSTQFPDHPDFEHLGFDEQRHAWLPPLHEDFSDALSFFWCGSQLFRYSWSEADSTWVPELWSEQNFSRDRWEYISAVDFSPINPTLGFLATSAGRLFTSDDAGITWTASEGEAPAGQYFYGNALLASTTNVDVAYVGGSGYSGPGVLRTTDAGASWHAFDEGIGQTLVYSLAQSPDGQGTLFAGTETSAMRRDADSEAWVDITGADAPITVYWSVEALTDENTVRFGTYGRGIWDYQLDPNNIDCFVVEDADGDGFDCDVDCDDSNADIHHGAEEVPCNGVDEDCDGQDLCEDTGDTGADDTGSDTAPDSELRACGCSSSPLTGAVFLLPLVVLLRRRRQPETP